MTRRGQPDILGRPRGFRIPQLRACSGRPPLVATVATHSVHVGELSMHVWTRLTPLVAVAIVVSASANAKPTSIEKQYKAAVKLESSGDVASALAAFEAIPPEQRDYNTLLHIAGCKKKLGRLLDAEQAYEAIRTDPKADIATVETAASDLEDVRSRIPRLRIRLTPGTTGVVVTVDGVAVTPPLEHRTNPGEHAVVTKRGELVVHERRVVVQEAVAIDVEIDAPVNTPAPRPSAAPVVIRDGGSDQAGTMPTLPFASILCRWCRSRRWRRSQHVRRSFRARQRRG